MCQSTYFHEVNLRKIPLFWQYKVEVSRVLLPYAQRPGICEGWEIEFRLPTTDADLNILLKLKAKAESCSSCPN